MCIMHMYFAYTHMSMCAHMCVYMCVYVSLLFIPYFLYTVPLKSKLTLETRTSRLDPRSSMLETFEDRVSSIEKQGFLEYAKTINDLFLEGRTIQYCLHLQ